MISCHAYDYVEIACMQRLKVRLHMHSGDIIEGVALDTVRTESNKEAILLATHNGLVDSNLLAALADPIKIELEHICSMEALTVNPYFTRVEICNM